MNKKQLSLLKQGACLKHEQDFLQLNLLAYQVKQLHELPLDEYSVQINENGEIILPINAAKKVKVPGLPSHAKNLKLTFKTSEEGHKIWGIVYELGRSTFNPEALNLSSASSSLNTTQRGIPIFPPQFPNVHPMQQMSFQLQAMKAHFARHIQLMHHQHSQEIAKLEQNILFLSNKLERNLIEKAQNSKQSLQTEVRMRAKIKTLTEKVCSLDSINDELRKENILLKENAKTDLAKLQEIDSMKQEYEAKESKHKEIITTLTQKVAILELKIVELEREYKSELEAHVKKFQAEMSKEVSSLQSTILKLKDTSEAKLANLKKDIKRQFQDANHTKIIKLREKISILKQQLKESQELNVAFNAELGESKITQDKMKVLYAGALRKLQEKDALHATLLSKLEELEEEHQICSTHNNILIQRVEESLSELEHNKMSENPVYELLKTIISYSMHFESLDKEQKRDLMPVLREMFSRLDKAIESKNFSSLFG